LGDIGDAYLELGAYEPAEEALRRALRAAERLGLSSLSIPVLTAKHNLGLALAMRGALEDAKRLETEAVEGAVTLGDRPLEGVCRTYLSRILEEGGALDAAEREAREAVAVLDVARAMRVNALGLLGGLLLRLGRAAEALDVCRQAMDLASTLGSFGDGESRVRLALAETLEATGQVEQAARAIAKARERLIARAERITDPTLRHSFLERVPENARTIALASSSVKGPS
jgi:tetratricopeptide (TPR) repeat protein